MLEGVPKGPAQVTKSGKYAGIAKVFSGVRLVNTITYKVDMSKVFAKRKLDKIIRQANKDVMLFWHTTLRQKHFTTKGFSEYKYQRRSRATVDIKKKKFGHNLPIVKVGDAWAMTGSIKALRSTPTTGTLTMAGPWYLGQRVTRKDGKQSPDLKSELTRVSHRDMMLMSYMGAKQIRKGIAEAKKARIGARTIKP
jgi:hypothetical protein